MESLELCTHWVMECFDAIHYTARAFCVSGIYIWGLGLTVRTRLLALAQLMDSPGLSTCIDGISPNPDYS